MYSDEIERLKKNAAGENPTPLPDVLLRELEKVPGMDALCGQDPKLDRAVEDAVRICPDLAGILPAHAYGLFLDLSRVKLVDEGSMAATARVARASKLAAKLWMRSYPKKTYRYAQMKIQFCQCLIVLAEHDAGVDTRLLLECAVEAGEESVAGFGERVNPEQWALANKEIAAAYLRLGVLADEREHSRRIFARAIEVCESAQRVMTRSNSQQIWADLQYKLARALMHYADTFEGKEARDKLARAAGAQETVLECFDKSANPQSWATAQEQLGLIRATQAGLESGSRACQFHALAAKAFEASAGARASNPGPGNLGGTYARLASSLCWQARASDKKDAPRLYVEAISAYESALRWITPQNMPEDCAYCHDDLGETLLSLAALSEGKKALRYLSRAEEVYQKAIRIASRLGDALFLANLHDGLVRTLRRQAMFATADEAMKLRRRAIALCEDASRGLFMGGNPVERLMMQNLLGTVVGEAADGCASDEEAGELYARAIRIFEDGLRICQGEADSQRGEFRKKLKEMRDRRDMRTAGKS